MQVRNQMILRHLRYIVLFVASTLLFAAAARAQLMPTTMGVKKRVGSRSVPKPANRPANRKTRTETVDNNETITVHRSSSGGATQGRSVNSTSVVKPKRPRNQDIEVENDETHWVGHDRTKRVTTANNSTLNSSNHSMPRNTRTETVNNNENRSSNFFGNTDPSHSYGKPRVRRSTGNKTRSIKTNRRSSPKGK